MGETWKLSYVISFGLVANQKSLQSECKWSLFHRLILKESFSYSFRYLLSTYYVTCPVLITREPDKFPAFSRVYNLLVEIDNKCYIKLNVLKKSRVGLQAREY